MKEDKTALQGGARGDGVHTSLRELMRLAHKARGFGFLPRQPIHSILSGKHTSRLRGRGLNFEELRNYLPGDEIRQMDWKASARTGEPHVRVYTEERDRPVFLVVDQRRSMFFGSKLKMKSVAAAEVAALGAWRSLDQGDRVGAVVFNDSECTVIKPQRSRLTVQQVLGEVTRMNQLLPGSAEGGQPPSETLNAALRKTEQLAKHDALICLISDFGGVDAESRKILTSAAQHNDVIAALVYDPLGAQLPNLGPAVFSEGPTQLEVDTSRQAIRSAFEREFDSRLAKVTRLLQQRAIPFFMVSAAEDPLQQIQHALGVHKR